MANEYTTEVVFSTQSSLDVIRLAVAFVPKCLLPSRKRWKKGKGISEGNQEGWQLLEVCLSG